MATIWIARLILPFIESLGCGNSMYCTPFTPLNLLVSFQTWDYFGLPLSLGFFIASYVLWRRLPGANTKSVRLLQKAAFNIFLAIYMVCYGYWVFALVCITVVGLIMHDLGAGFIAIAVGMLGLVISVLVFFILFLVRIIQFFALRNSIKRSLVKD